MERNEQRESRGKQQSKKERLRGHDKDAPDIRISKTLSWVLRHGASSEGLFMRPDGYVRVKDLLALPKLHMLDFMMLERIVQEDTKMRYHLLLNADTNPDASGDAAQIWWIRANQGHSIKSIKLDLTPITDSGQVPMAVHGTTLQAWAKIQRQGLSKMNRNHIHLAQGVAGEGVISGMRTSSQVLIYIDLSKALKAGIKFHISENGVVLSEGDEKGFLRPEFFWRVERANRQPIPGWEGPVGGLDVLTSKMEAIKVTEAEEPSNQDPLSSNTEEKSTS
ncbi:hypothetical protein BD410DRAFT_786724 [Rickenella mellea]|uniref:2'-phosphotransferase n=1 Tax=Rickenella mellea TaxID=50990 RepID=A0A4Y7QB23_9AGAM|nr:hypothetical protein BD410DRAFT_786724 [Rickenella mellea]